MATSLETKLQTALQAATSITSLLASRSDGKAAIYDMQEVPGSAFPAITVLVVSIVNEYSTTVRLVNALCRVQFTIWDTNPERARTVETALVAFLDSFNAYDAVNAAKPRQPNWVAMRRQGGNAQTQPVTYWRIVDAFIWNNESL